MPEKEVENLSDLLRARVSRFLNRWASHPNASSMASLMRRGETVALFGGTLRDLMVWGESSLPRDIDLVIGDSDTSSLTTILGQGKANSFGGRRVKLDRTEIDYWPLPQTWAFRALDLGRGEFEDLARTTFLNVEAIAIQLKDLPRWRPGPWESIFFQGFLDRIIEINLEDNPNPLGCMTRSIVTASRLGFAIGPRLASYIDRVFRGKWLEEIIDFQRFHYRTIIFSIEQLAFVQTSIRSHMRTRRSLPFQLFTSRE